MATMITFTCLVQSSSLSTLSVTPKLYSPKTLLLPHRAHGCFSPCQSSRALQFKTADIVPAEKRGLSLICSYNAGEESDTKGSVLDWPILKRWDVPWNWQTVSLTSLACGLSFVLIGLIEAAALPYLGLQLGELSLDEKAEILFVDQSITTAAVLAIMYSLTNYEPLPDDFFRYGVCCRNVYKTTSGCRRKFVFSCFEMLSESCCWLCYKSPNIVIEVGCIIVFYSYLHLNNISDWREPFNLQKGWLLWAGIGLLGALASIALTGAIMSLFRGENPQRETDALVLLLPLIGSSSTSTACLVGITGVLAPLLEETVFRGFFMVSLTKWLPTPLSVLVSAAVFAVAHLTPGEFPQLFVLGTALGFSYAHTRNLLTPITIHAIWNSAVILFLTFLQLQGYDIKELLQSS